MEDLRERIAARYREPHRRYHDLRHLEEVLEAVDLLAAEAGDLEVVRWAAWFHDAVYEPAADDNEERSALLATEELAAYDVDPAAVRDVARLVRLTASHDPAPGDPDGAVLCDADLAVLAAAPDRYAAYAHDVRVEYAHVDDRAFATGRAGVLSSLLGRDALYRTRTGHRLWDDRARANVSAELARLRASAHPGA
ncbi:MAG: metal-dependent phosphohydrolase [Actinomycetota bacterium]|nr:metal-dependent phosphohydrolase [Actinomycetota bacterium]